uniref:Peptide-methionine (R)-S-oxide reductase n=1 Tax=Globisporangium ultimum (strain ATCC 200006 / CBS 805.95 / DAOM BR144) TaxID=431595 RepID=K3X944_GLOUD
MAAASERANRSETEWKAQLTPLQYQVLRLKGTEPAGSGEYDAHFAASGTYVCSGCHAPLYTADKKFDSGCGWPAFYDVLPHAIKKTPVSDDPSCGEIVCAACDGHLGHVIRGEGHKMPTDKRHCINSVAIVFHDDIVAAEPSA